MNKINIAIVGCGTEGAKLVKNVNQLPHCQLKACCDRDKTRLKLMKSFYPDLEISNSYEKIVSDSSIDAVVIATPLHTHYELGMKCIKNNKHVLIQTALAATTQQCRELIALAEKYDRRLMVGHLYEYSPAVIKTKEIIDSGELGEIYYISSVRVKPEFYHPDISVIWELAPYDISIILCMLDSFPISVSGRGLDSFPISVSGRGKAYFKNHVENVAIMTLNFDNGGVAFIHNSWLDPCDIKRTTIVGSKKMLIYDENNITARIKVYDKGIEAPPFYDAYAESAITYPFGRYIYSKIEELRCFAPPM